jgi:ABC-type transport system involved in cytochrome bd biosynthesis fused ATPase/permease subunit
VSVALVALLALAVGFAVFCLLDVLHAESARYLPKWAWAIICVVSIPLGGIVYLTIGRRSGSAQSLAPVRDPTRPRRDASHAESAPVAAPPARPTTRAATIEINRLSKHFGSVVAVDDLSFEVRPGRVTGFLGPNGAGKTTTIRIILGLETPTAGRTSVCGRPYQGFVRPLREVGSLLDANAAHPGRSAWMHTPSRSPKATGLDVSVSQKCWN